MSEFIGKDGLRRKKMKWAKDGHGTGCAVCAKPFKKGSTRYTVHVVDGGTNILHKEDSHKHTDSGADLGHHEIGSGCVKHFGKNYATKVKGGMNEDKLNEGDISGKHYNPGRRPDPEMEKYVTKDHIERFSKAWKHWHGKDAPRKKYDAKWREIKEDETVDEVFNRAAVYNDSRNSAAWRNRQKKRALTKKRVKKVNRNRRLSTVKASQRKNMQEGTINEISSDLARRYYEKSRSAEDLKNTAAGLKGKNRRDARAYAIRKVKNRSQGEGRAFKRMYGEDTINELSPQTLASYAGNAAGELRAKAWRTGFIEGRFRNPDMHKNHNLKAQNRQFGIERATKKIAQKVKTEELDNAIAMMMYEGFLKLNNNDGETSTRSLVNRKWRTKKHPKKVLNAQQIKRLKANDRV